MKCLIIAAGQGTRLSGVGDSKPLILLLGKPLIVRVIETMRSAGITDFVVVTGYNREKVESALNTAKTKLKVDIDFVYNPEWEKQNGISVLKGSEKLLEPFFLVMTDHMFDPKILEKMKNTPMGNHAVKLAVDTRLINNPLVDLDDVTKVLMNKETGNIIDIGKTIKHCNAFDTGIFRCTPVLFDALKTSIENGDSSLSGGIRILAADGKAGVMDIDDSFWLDVDNEEMLKKAETLLNGILK
jgi:choline kinase